MKKLLLITYYFPPCGGAGVQRWLRFIRYLPDHGWMPTVITTTEGDYPHLDSSLCKKIPIELKIIRTRTPVLKRILKLIPSEKGNSYPYGTLKTEKGDRLSKKLLYWIRNNLVVPDSRVIWNRIACKAAIHELRIKKYDLIITTGPPHSTHLVGMALKKRLLTRWVADFRDPWTSIYYLQNTRQNIFLQRINRNLEQRVIEAADLNIVISQPIANSFPKGNKLVLTNGYDPDDFFNVETVSSSFFRIKYIGKLTEGQDVTAPLTWLNELAREENMVNLEFSFIGTIPTEEEYEQDYSFLHIRNVGYKTHLKAISEMVNSDVLLLLINNCSDNNGILTTKLFEYIGSRSYILGIGPPEGEAAKILDKYKAGIMLDYTDREGFASKIRELYQRWDKSEDLKNDSDISELSARNQTRELSKILDDLESKKPVRR